MKREVYLGDGLYGAFDGEFIELWAEREGQTHKVYIERLVWKNLQEFAQKMGFRS